MNARKSCFVVSPFGASDDEKLFHQQVLEHLIRRVLEPSYEVVRADEIDEDGLISNQIIEHLLEDDLVVADLTGSNPNVFYEIAIRHAAAKPLVHLIKKGHDIPFDISHVRSIQFDLDPDPLDEARQQLARKVKAIENNSFQAGLNPVTSVREQSLLRKSAQPEMRQLGQLLEAFDDVRHEVRALERRFEEAQWGKTYGRGPGFYFEAIKKALADHPAKVSALSLGLGIDPQLVGLAIEVLAEKDEVRKLGSGEWSLATDDYWQQFKD